MSILAYRNESFCEIISVLLHISVITQDGYSALMIAAREGNTEVVLSLVEAGANTDLQNKVESLCICIYKRGSNGY